MKESIIKEFIIKEFIVKESLINGSGRFPGGAEKRERQIKIRR